MVLAQDMREEFALYVCNDGFAEILIFTLLFLIRVFRKLKIYEMKTQSRKKYF